jgi:hypothetical protein
VGVVVLIHADKPRTYWKLGVVEEVNRGNDGLVRSANVRTAKGRTNRPITRLHPLEVQGNQIQDNTTKEAAYTETLRRSKRQAARQARSGIAECFKD